MQHGRTRNPGAPPPSGGGSRGTPPKPAPKNLRERFAALRSARWALPIATLFVGKLIIDEVVALPHAGVTFKSLGAGLASGDFNCLGLWIGCEFGLAVLSDRFGRLVSLVDSLTISTRRARVSA